MIQSNLSKKSLQGKSQFDLSKSAENVIDKKKMKIGEREKKISPSGIGMFVY